jgi:hypothetical protein
VQRRYGTVRKARLAGAVAALWLVAPPAGASSLPTAANCPMFPADNIWHSDVSQLSVNSRSSQYVASIGTGAHVHADFGSGRYNGGPIGIPYDVVGAGQPTTSVTFDYDSESDHVPYPLPANPSIEGGPNASGDRHVIVVDNSTCTLYELFNATPNGDGTWHAGSGAVWNLNSNALRPDTWTSADAAGLPILPGLVRYDEVASGRIDHAIRVTVPSSDRSYLWPARHQAGTNNANLPPMGLRLRLRASFDVSPYPHDDQVILQAMKTYGVIVADNGSPWYISGVPDDRWNNDVLHQLGNVSGADFEAVDESSLMVDPNSGQSSGSSGAAAATWLLRDSNTTGVADHTFMYGAAGDTVLACDWNGDGVSSPTVYRNGAFYERDTLTSGAADRVVPFGAPGDQPICGDWNGQGKDSIGVRRGNSFFLRNSNTTGVADITIGYGDPDDQAIVGDWNGDGTDTIGIHRGGAFYLRNSNTTGVADITVGYGDPGDQAIVGDWNGDHRDTIAIHRGGTFYLRNSNTTGVADITIGYGDAGDFAIVGDWNGHGKDTLGIVRGQ